MKKCRIIWYIETKWPSSSWIQPSSNKIFLLISIFFRADRSSRWFKGSYIAWLSKIRLSWFRMSRDYIQGVWSRSWRHPRWRLSCSMQSTNVVKKTKKEMWETVLKHCDVSVDVGLLDWNKRGNTVELQRSSCNIMEVAHHASVLLSCSLLKIFLPLLSKILKKQNKLIYPLERRSGPFRLTFTSAFK